MGNALNATGREILYSICNWGQDSPWDWGPSVGNSWRISGDIVDNFADMSPNCVM
jgi:alpha-galactosidase